MSRQSWKSFRDKLRKMFYPRVRKGKHLVKLIDIRLRENATFPYFEWKILIIETDQVLIKTISTRKDNLGLDKLQKEMADIGINLPEEMNLQKEIIEKFFKGKKFMIYYDNSDCGEVIFLNVVSE